MNRYFRNDVHFHKPLACKVCYSLNQLSMNEPSHSLIQIIDDDGFGTATVEDKEKKKSKKNAAKYVDKGERPRLKETKKKGSDSDEDELSYATLEDRPQIAGFVDERPEVEIMKERRFTTSTFKVIQYLISLRSDPLQKG